VGESTLAIAHAGVGIRM